MKTIRDALHGNINFSDSEICILDTPEMQRLRRIKQLGFTYLVYPSATHTRFEHSIGTFFLAEKLALNLGLKKEDAEKLKLAALLHDTGHGPFSHASENAINMHLAEKEHMHEKYTQRIIEKSMISEIIKKSGFRPREISEISTGKKLPLGTFMSGEIDVDRMDYLVRDSYYTGVAYGLIDLERLLDTIKLKGKKAVIEIDGLLAAEALVRARYLMYPAVYEHHTTRIANAMFSFAVISCLEEKILSIEELYAMDDTDLISKLRSISGFAGTLIKKIEERQLYKRAVVLGREGLKKNYTRLLKLKHKKLRVFEKELCSEAHLKEGEVILDIPRPLYPEEASAMICEREKCTALKEISPLVSTLSEAQWNYWNVAVYCSEKNVKKVRRVSEGILKNF